MTQVPAGDSGDSGGREEGLRRFFHDFATPLSGLSLHLDRATKLLARGEDPAEALATARQELEKAFVLFERSRAEILAP
jgi:hypothetical protein